MIFLKKKFLFFYIFICLIIFGGYSLSFDKNVIKGYFDLSKTDLNKNWKKTLNGDWEFYWNQLLTPEDFKNKNDNKIDYLIVPSIWKNKPYENFKLPKFGYGTYRIKIGPVIKGRILSIDIGRILTSYKLWVDDELLNENGKVGINKSGSVPNFSKKIISFYPKNENIEIIIQVSNYYDARGGGIFRNIKIGDYHSIEQSNIIDFAFNLFLIGFLLFAVINHLGIYLLRKNEKISLNFCIVFLIYIIRILLANNNFLFYLFPDLSWEFFFKIEILTVIISTPFVLSIIYYLFPQIISKKIRNFYYLISFLYTLILIIIPPPNFILVLIYFYPVVFIICLNMIYWIIKTIYLSKTDSLLFGIAFIVFLLTIINDVLFSFSLSQIPQMIPLGLLLFAAIQAFIIARRISESFYKQEELSAELMDSQKRLEKNNILLEDKVKERTIDLENQIKEREKIEKEIVKNQKLDAIGLLAGGIAHDFNNYLSIIMGNVSLLKLIKDKEQFNLALKDTESACKNATLLTNQLLTFSRGGEPIKQTLNVSNIIKEVTDLIIRGTGIIIEYNIGKNLWLCDVDKGQITQVITNLIINAKQAMNNNGKIIINLDNIEDKIEFQQIKIKDKFVRIQIQDNGIGISKENLNKVFDPFFTTKQNGKGLGLTTSFSIIKKHNGLIFVDSEEKKGSTFTIFIPANISNEKNEIIKKDSDSIKKIKGNPKTPKPQNPKTP